MQLLRRLSVRFIFRHWVEEEAGLWKYPAHPKVLNAHYSITRLAHVSPVHCLYSCIHGWRAAPPTTTTHPAIYYKDSS